MKDYTSKIISVEKALSFVESDNCIMTAVAAAAPQAFLSELHTIADRVRNVNVNLCLSLRSYEFLESPEYEDSFEVVSWFYGPGVRKAQKVRKVTYCPNHLRYMGRNRLKAVHPHIFVGCGTYPDENGKLSLSLSSIYETEVMKAADIVIIEMNKKCPRTFGDVELHVDDVDYLIETDYDIPVVPSAEPNEKDMTIGKYIAEYIQDGDCIQLGIGGIPNAVARSLYDKKNLGVHTEMLTTEMVKLAKAGIINGSCKQIDKGQMVATFAMGTEEMYEYMDNNPTVKIASSIYVTDPNVVAQNDNQVSINTTLEVDLTGQCCSESIGQVQFSGTGGQSDTAIGAQLSKNGRSFIALYSTAMVRNPQTGEKEETSKIVCQLKPGAAVSLSRNDIEYLVTEYGVVNLKGRTVRERVELIISIAHPKFREQLMQEAREAGLI